MFLLTTYDILIVCATVVVSFALPRLPAPFATHALSRLLVCVLVVVLCVCLPRQLGVPLALLLVLSTVPTVRLELLANDHVSHTTPINNKDTDMLEAFANAKDEDEIVDRFSQKKMGEKAITDKMEVFTRINTKQDEFKQQLNTIQKNLKDVREFYANADAKYKKEIGQQ